MVRRRRGNKGLAKLVRKEVQRINAKNTEVKHREVSASYSVSDTPLGYNFLEYIGQGDGALNREGNRINLLSHSMRLNIRAEQPYNNIRIMVLETRDPLPYSLTDFKYDGSEVLSSPGLGVNSSLDFDTVKKVYYDRTIQVKQLANGVNPTFYVRKYLKFGKLGKKIFYDGNTTGVNSGNMRSHIYVLLMSDSSIVPHPSINAGHYMRFTDS